MDTNTLARLLTGGRKSKPAQVNKSGGHFDGKLGTPRRSRKGRTYRAPNGYVEYVPTLEEWQRAGLCGGRKISTT
jgi:hypothetical protein